MEQLTLNIASKSTVKIIASSAYNFRVELIEKIGNEDANEIINISKDLSEVFGNDVILTKDNILKYFSEETFPFIAKSDRRLRPGYRARGNQDDKHV